MLRIGQFCDSFLPVVDGVGRVVIAYAESLCAMGHQVTVSSPMYDTGYRGGYPFELVDYNAVHVPGAKQYKTGRTVMDMHYRKRMEMIQLDIAHTHTPFGGGAEALRIARHQDIPVVYTFHSKFHDDFFKATKSEKLAELGVKYVVNFMNRCDEVWTVSDAASDVIRDYGYKGTILTIPNGVKIRSPTQCCYGSKCSFRTSRLSRFALCRANGLEKKYSSHTRGICTSQKKRCRFPLDIGWTGL
jgi:glycosyltransferase involved in cell wall biosynthesis